MSLSVTRKIINAVAAAVATLFLLLSASAINGQNTSKVKEQSFSMRWAKLEVAVEALKTKRRVTSQETYRIQDKIDALFAAKKLQQGWQSITNEGIKKTTLTLYSVGLSHLCANLLQKWFDNRDLEHMPQELLALHALYLGATGNYKDAYRLVQKNLTKNLSKDKIKSKQAFLLEKLHWSILAANYADARELSDDLSASIGNGMAS